MHIGAYAVFNTASIGPQNPHAGIWARFAVHLDDDLASVNVNSRPFEPRRHIARNREPQPLPACIAKPMILAASEVIFSFSGHMPFFGKEPSNLVIVNPHMAAMKVSTGGQARSVVLPQPY